MTELERRSRNGYVPHVALALAYAGLNEIDRAVNLLEGALAVRDVHLIYGRWDPKWDRLRPNARFEALLKRC